MQGRIKEILKQQSILFDAYNKYNKLQTELERLQSKCSHENSYYYSQDKDTYESRTYDVNYCEDCGLIHQTRCYMGKHKYPSKKEYIENQNK